MKRKDAIICLGAGTSQSPFLMSAKKRGLYTISFDRNPEAVGQEYSDVFYNVSIVDIEQILKILENISITYNVRGVIAPITGPALHTAYKVTDFLKLPGLSKKMVDLSTEKSTMREFCNLHDLPVPNGFLITPHQRIINSIEYPVIVKPDGTTIGKTNISYCESSQDLIKSIKTAEKISSNSKVEVEEYIDGIDVTCICWAQNGIARIIVWIDEFVGIDSQNKIVGLGIGVPSIIIGTKAQEKAIDIVYKLISHFHKVNSILLISFRITAYGEPYIIEVHTDLGGDLIADVLLPAACPSFDFFDLVIKIATGDIKTIEPVKFQPSTLGYLSGISPIGIVNYTLIQESRIDNNLRVFEKFIKENYPNLKIYPQHSIWYTKNK